MASAVESKSMKGRLGKLVEFAEHGAESVRTPAYLVYTRAGHIPHLTWNLVTKHLNFDQAPIYQLTLSSVYNIIRRLDGGVAELSNFFKFPENSLVHLSIHDPLSTQECGFNKSSSVSLWSKGGRQDISPAALRIALTVIRPHSFSTPFDYDTPRNCKDKRLMKSMVRATEWCDQLCGDNDDGFKSAAFVSLGGGFSPCYRSKLAKQLCSRPYAKAFAIDLSSFSLNRLFSQADGEEGKNSRGDNFDEVEIKGLLAGVMTELDPFCAKLVEGPFDPRQIFTLFQLGVDIFDSSYAVWLAEQGKGFKLSDDYPLSPSGFKIVDFNDSRYQDDSTPLFDCVCYSCSNYSKNYLQHLQSTREMLAQILLVVHNLQEFDRMFTRLREFSEGQCAS